MYKRQWFLHRSGQKTDEGLRRGDHPEVHGEIVQDREANVIVHDANDRVEVTVRRSAGPRMFSPTDQDNIIMPNVGAIGCGPQVSDEENHDKREHVSKDAVQRSSNGDANVFILNHG